MAETGVVGIAGSISTAGGIALGHVRDNGRMPIIALESARRAVRLRL
jgi:hypothetical protein